MSELNLRETSHPNKAAKATFDSLIGIDDHKKELLNHLHFFFEPQKYSKWKDKHHPKGVPAFENDFNSSPVFILSGEVGCGKTALAQSIGTPLAEMLEGTPVTVLETPSNIRGSGRVGELSDRITEAFQIAQKKIANKPGILIIDEADDLATSRSQNQAHHEDRAGLNVLIKQLDLLKTNKSRLAVILITNRPDVIDPAVLRRSDLQLYFDRPNDEQYGHIFEHLLTGTDYSKRDIESLLKITAKKKPRYSFSDLIIRVGKTAFRESIFNNVPYGPKPLMHVLEKTEPTPLLTKGQI